MIKVEGVSKNYTLGKTTVRALENVNLQIEKGDFIALTGPSGSGKTTLQNIIGCLDRPNKGSVEIDGEKVNTLSKNRLSEIRADKIGFIFQSFNLVPVLNVYENIEFPTMLSSKKLKSSEKEKKINELIEAVGLSEHWNHKPDELSGGQRQRVAIARALVNDPLIVLADEPTANLDTETAEQIIALLQSINKEYNTTFVFSTHDGRLLKYANTVYRMKDGVLELNS